MTANEREISYRKLVFGALPSRCSASLLFVVLSEMELDLFSIVEDKELSVTVVESQSPSVKPPPSVPVPTNPLPEKPEVPSPPEPAETRTDSQNAVIVCICRVFFGERFRTRQRCVRRRGGTLRTRQGWGARDTLRSSRTAEIRSLLVGVFVGKAELEHFAARGQ